MIIGGFQTTTLLDYPGKVACTIFTAACNMRCPFCQNSDLITGSFETRYSEEDVLTYLSKRKGLLDGVCITGGEPTLQKDLAEFICKIKDLGLLVKLDSNGLNPDIIKMLYSGNLIDMVAMDIKSGPSTYGVACGIKDIDMGKIKESIDFLITSGIDYEFRTTLVKGIHRLEDMEEITSLIKGAKAYFLQSYKESDKLLGLVDGNKEASTYSSFSRNELEEFLDIAKKVVPGAMLRGVD